MNSIELESAYVVFEAYVQQGYYSADEREKAVETYLTECKMLEASVLNHLENGQIVGTLMCAVDRGNLPVDNGDFVSEMIQLRQDLGSIKLGYFGKFGTLPGRECDNVGRKLLIRAVTEWAFIYDVQAVVMMVNPKHVSCYVELGAKIVASVGSTPGLEKAPAVLLVLKFSDSRQITRVRNFYLSDRLHCN